MVMVRFPLGVGVGGGVSSLQRFSFFPLGGGRGKKDGVSKEGCCCCCV